MHSIALALTIDVSTQNYDISTEQIQTNLEMTCKHTELKKDG
jgi:hypothetical protein